MLRVYKRDGESCQILISAVGVTAEVVGFQLVPLVLQPDAYPGQRHRKLRRLTGLHIKQEDKGTQGKEGCV